jgi:[acyl-carrier-protein] S-malonyltransferase
MPVAILCSGQGPQHPAMFQLTGELPEATELFAHASALLGGDPRAIARTGTPAALHENRTGQILCCLQALAAASALRDALSDGAIVAGYSVGEVAAWGVAGLFAMNDTLDLVASPAEAMDAAAAPGEGMPFVRGLGRGTIDKLCEGRDAAVAIVNPDNAFVVGGSSQALAALAEEAKALNATRVVELPIDVASHTASLAAASAMFRSRLGETLVKPAPTAGMRVLSGIDGAPVIDVRAGVDKLAAQISHTVQWSDCLQGCVEAGASVFLELGPGRALAKMAGDAYPAVPARSVEEFRTFEGAAAWIRKCAEAPVKGSRTALLAVM